MQASRRISKGWEADHISSPPKEQSTNTRWLDVMALSTMEYQTSLPGLCPVKEAVALMATAGVEERGAIFTRREVVEFILDLTGYTSDKPLHRLKLLEPAMGQGDFLTPIIDRLFEAYRREKRNDSDLLADLGDCLLAVELHLDSYEQTRTQVAALLRAKGLSARASAGLCDQWLKQGDFLLFEHDREFTHVIGNPPYVRQEMIPDVLMAEYRQRYRTIYDRADIYIPFIEQSLSLLAPGGVLGFICADRWLKNRYGGPLRRYVSERFHLQHFVDMVGTNAFLSDVVAYPGIVVIGRGNSGPTRIASRPAIEAVGLQGLALSMNAKTLATEDGAAEPVPCIVMAEGDDAKAIEASLAENIACLPMDEIDQYKAFAALRNQGLDAAGIAYRFGVTERLVAQRLAIAAIIPPILNAYRREEISAGLTSSCAAVKATTSFGRTSLCR